MSQLVGVAKNNVRIILQKNQHKSVNMEQNRQINKPKQEKKRSTTKIEKEKDLV